MSEFEACYEDAFNLMCGAKIGSGINRTVFVYRINPEWVVKVEVGNDGNWQNINEYKTWLRAQDLPARRWFAPVEWISNNGRVMLQQRTTPVDPKKLPAKMPAFLCDFKHENYGMLNGRLVAHDYGLTWQMEHGLRTGKMMLAKWHKGSE